MKAPTARRPSGIPLTALCTATAILAAGAFPALLPEAAAAAGHPARTAIRTATDKTPPVGAPLPGPPAAAAPVPAPTAPKSPTGETTAPDPDALKGPDRERDYFARWHAPHGAVLDRDVLEGIWRGVRAMPAESPDLARTASPWRPLGPYGIDAGTDGASPIRYSGRILDLDFNGSGLRLASASGGLWEYQFFIPVTLTEKLDSQAIGSVATDPLDDQHIFVGTGEGRVRGGTGLYVTTDGGTKWDPVSLPIDPTAFYRIRYAPGRPTHIYAATDSGLVRSTDSGANWTYEMSGEVSDIAIWELDPDRMWAGRWEDGIYESTDAGDTWTKLRGAVIPTTDVGRTALTAHPGLFPVVYASIARDSDNGMLGVYRTVDGGFSWTDVSPPADIFGFYTQGDYDNAIAVNPDDWQNVIVGGVSAWRTLDAGATWTQIADPDMHADVHALLWNNGTVYAGHDGGFCSSADGGVTWDSSIDVLPTMQYYNIDVGLLEPTVMGGGTQDNGVSVTLDGGGNWTQEIDQDGGGFAVDVANPVQNLWATKGPTGYSWTFPRYRTTDRGLTWSLANTGIPASTQWFTQIRHDRVAPVFLYANSGPHIFQSTDYGASWDSLNTTGFAWSTAELAVSGWQPGGSTLYAATASGQQNQLWVYDGAVWTDRTAGLPVGKRIRRISIPDYDPASAYVLMSGITPGQQVYRTRDRGVTWTNVTGNLPDVPVGDLVEHPTDPDRLFLGTETGCFRSTNGGASWIRWNEGMPEANLVTDFATVDSLSSVGRYYIVAGTYGRGLWEREISAEDVTGVAAFVEESARLRLEPSRPNPARDRARIEFSLAEARHVELDVFDVAGRRMAWLVDGDRAAGRHGVEVDVGRWAAGVYFVHLRAGGRGETRRMMVVR